MVSFWLTSIRHLLCHLGPVRTHVSLNWSNNFLRKIVCLVIRVSSVRWSLNSRRGGGMPWPGRCLYSYCDYLCFLFCEVKRFVDWRGCLDVVLVVGGAFVRGHVIVLRGLSFDCWCYFKTWTTHPYQRSSLRLGTVVREKWVLDE